jgi:ubiquinone/menaquinone biosynthesis C-methylase UbiE
VATSEEKFMASLSSPTLSQRDRAEVIRSAEEARLFPETSFNRDQVQRYLSPSRDTPYPLEYAFYLLGDVRAKTVLDLGCGMGENLVPLAERGAKVIGIDVSPDLVRLAERRIALAGIKADVVVGSAYEIDLPDESVDVVFCIALIHHLDIPRACSEMFRVLKKGGYIALLEPIRFSRSYDRCRKLLPSHQITSEYEHPLTKSEFASLTDNFTADNLRYFRLPIVPLAAWLLGANRPWVCKLSAWLIGTFPVLQHFATSAVVRLRKSDELQSLTRAA